MGVLLFDLDGVLVDSLVAYREAWTAWATAYRVTRQEFPSDIHGLRPKDVIRQIRPAVDLEQAVEAFDALLDGPAGEQVTAMAGAVRLTADLAGSPWAIVSSTQRRHVTRMLSCAGIALPPVLICGDDIERGKPDPQCFLLGAERLGAPSSSCTVVEDAPSGIAAAAAAGMSAIALATTHRPEELSGAERVFPSLWEAKDFLLGRARNRQP
ncbi:MAG: HAD family hydrolase [Actinomycetota bacterium]